MTFYPVEYYPTYGYAVPFVVDSVDHHQRRRLRQAQAEERRRAAEIQRAYERAAHAELVRRREATRAYHRHQRELEARAAAEHALRVEAYREAVRSQRREAARAAQAEAQRRAEAAAEATRVSCDISLKRQLAEQDPSVESLVDYLNSVFGGGHNSYFYVSYEAPETKKHHSDAEDAEDADDSEEESESEDTAEATEADASEVVEAVDSEDAVDQVIETVAEKESTDSEEPTDLYVERADVDLIEREHEVEVEAEVETTDQQAEVEAPTEAQTEHEAEEYVVVEAEDAAQVEETSSAPEVAVETLAESNGSNDSDRSPEDQAVSAKLDRYEAEIVRIIEVRDRVVAQDIDTYRSARSLSRVVQDVFLRSEKIYSKLDSISVPRDERKRKSALTNRAVTLAESLESLVSELRVKAENLAASEEGSESDNSSLSTSGSRYKVTLEDVDDSDF